MAKIKELYNDDDKFTLLLEVDKKEIGERLNILDDVFIFTKENLNYNTKVVKRGVSELTQYVLFPIEIRPKFKKGESNKKVKFGKINNNTYIFRLGD